MPLVLLLIGLVIAYPLFGICLLVHVICFRYIASRTDLVLRNGILRYITLCGIFITASNYTVNYIVSSGMCSTYIVDQLLSVSIICYLLSFFLCILLLVMGHKLNVYMSSLSFKLLLFNSSQLVIGVFVFLSNCSYLLVGFYLHDNVSALLLIESGLSVVGVPSTYAHFAASLLCYEYVFMLFIYVRTMYRLWVICDGGTNICASIDYCIFAICALLGFYYDSTIMRRIYDYCPSLFTFIAFFCVRYFIFEYILGVAPAYIVLSFFIFVVMLDRLLMYNVYQTFTYIFFFLVMCFCGYALHYCYMNDFCYEYCAVLSMYRANDIKQNLDRLVDKNMNIFSSFSDDVSAIKEARRCYLSVRRAHRKYYSNLYFSLLRLLLVARLKHMGEITESLSLCLASVNDPSFDASKVLDIYSIECSLFCGLQSSSANYSVIMSGSIGKYYNTLHSYTNKCKGNISKASSEGILSDSPEMVSVLSAIYEFAIYFVPAHMNFHEYDVYYGYKVYVYETLSYLTDIFIDAFYKSCLYIIDSKHSKLEHKLRLSHILGEGLSIRYFDKHIVEDLLFVDTKMVFFRDTDIQTYILHNHYTIIDYMVYIDTFFLNNDVHVFQQLKLVCELSAEGDLAITGDLNERLAHLIEEHVIQFFDISYGKYSIFKRLFVLYAIWSMPDITSSNITDEGGYSTSAKLIIGFLAFVKSKFKGY